jgi:hypothetical protein
MQLLTFKIGLPHFRNSQLEYEAAAGNRLIQIIPDWWSFVSVVDNTFPC